MAAGVRVVPIAVLATLALLALAARVHRKAHAPPSAIPQSPTSSEPVDGTPGLAAVLPNEPARVVEHAARMIHGDPHHTHRAAARAPRAVHVAWVYVSEGPVETQVTTAPDEETLYVASLGGTLAALGRDGVRRWAASLGGRVYATPCVSDDGTIYVGSDAGRFLALAPDGHVRWTIETGSDADTGAVLAKDGAILFGAGPRVWNVLPTGDIAWRFQATGKIYTSPALTDEGLAVVGSQDHHVYALTAKGTTAWSTDLGGDVDGAPAVGDDGAIYVGTDNGEIVRLDSTGGIVWRLALGGFVRGTLSVARNGDVLAGVYGPLPRLARVTRDGVLRGAFSVPGTGAREFGVHGGALEDADGTLLFGAQDDAVYAVDAKGALIWRFQTGGDVDSPLTLLSDGTLIVPSDDGRVVALSSQ